MDNQNNQARAVKQTQRIRDRIKAKAGLSSAGMRWIEQVCDPFPDEVQSGFVGFVDANQSKSVVMEIKQGITLTKPASLAAGKWSSLIFFSGNLRPSDIPNRAPGDRRFCQPCKCEDVRYLFGNDGVGTGVYPVDPITIFSGLDGEHLFPDNDASPWTATNPDRWRGLDLESYMKNRCRLLGGAIEVHDISPELYKSGSLTVADIPSTVLSTTGLTRDEDFNNVQFLVQQFRFNAPPATLDEATLLPGSRTWEAKEGVYAVLKQSKADNPYLPTQAGTPIWSDSYPAVTPDTFGTFTIGVGTPPNPNAQSLMIAGTTYNTLVPYGVPTQPAPFDIKCILLSGLDPNASYRINFNAIIEAIPDLQDKQLLVLAKPSPPLDTAAIELYSEIMGELPAGVPVSENNSGEWLSKVLGALDKYAGPIGNTLGALGVPMASMIGQGVSKGAALGKAALDKKTVSQAKKKTK